MAIKYSFVDSCLYGTEDINDITRCLTGAGVATIKAKDSYTLSELNELTAALVAAGVMADGCKCSAQNIGTAEMMVTVAPGIIFFDSGVRLEIDEDGYMVAVKANTAGYIYAHYSSALQKADVVFGKDLPLDGEYVLLAEVLNDGAIVDKRTFARSKVATMGKNISLEPSFEEVEPEFIGTNDAGYRMYVLAKISPVDLSKFNYALIRSTGYYSWDKILDLADAEDSIYLHEMYTSGPFNCAQVVDNRLCIVQYSDEGKGPYTPIGIENIISPYKVILV